MNADDNHLVKKPGVEKFWRLPACAAGAEGSSELNSEPEKPRSNKVTKNENTRCVIFVQDCQLLCYIKRNILSNLEDNSSDCDEEPGSDKAVDEEVETAVEDEEEMRDGREDEHPGWEAADSVILYFIS